MPCLYSTLCQTKAMLSTAYRRPHVGLEMQEKAAEEKEGSEQAARVVGLRMTHAQSNLDTALA